MSIDKVLASASCNRSDAGQDGEQQKSVEHSNTHLQGIDPKKGLETVLRALCQRGGVSLYNLVAELSQPVEVEFGKSMTECKTSEGCLNWAVDMGGCERWHCVRDIWDVWHGWTLSLRLGLTSTHIDAPRLATDEIAEVLGLGYKYLLALTGYEILFQEGYHTCPPFVFAALVSEQREVSEPAMARCKALWVALQQLETGGTHVEQRLGWLQSMVWPTSTWVRECLVSLHETDWRRVPPDLESEIRA
eukprot:2326046-Amphidinium_carterae.1